MRHVLTALSPAVVTCSARSGVRHRQRLHKVTAAPALQWHGSAEGDVSIAGASRAARWPRGSRSGWEVLPAVHVRGEAHVRDTCRGWTRGLGQEAAG